VRKGHVSSNDCQMDRNAAWSHSTLGSAAESILSTVPPRGTAPGSADVPTTGEHDDRSGARARGFSSHIPYAWM